MQRSCNISGLVVIILNLDCSTLPWHGAAKSEIENFVGNKLFENAEHENIFEVEKVGAQNSVIWNHKDSDSIHVDHITPTRINTFQTVRQTLNQSMI